MPKYTGTAMSQALGDSEISELRRELDASRRALVSVNGEEIEELLTSYRKPQGGAGGESTSSYRRVERWMDTVADGVLNLAAPEDVGGGYHTSVQARCPLCRGKSSTPFALGFTFPLGLHKHLLGKGNAHQCKVMKAAFELAEDYAAAHD